MAWNIVFGLLREKFVFSTCRFSQQTIYLFRAIGLVPYHLKTLGFLMFAGVKEKDQCHEMGVPLFQICISSLDPLHANPTQWSNTLKQLFVFDHFVGLARKGLNTRIFGRKTVNSRFFFFPQVDFRELYLVGFIFEPRNLD